MKQQRYGDWIKTFTSKQFFPLDPHLEDIDIIDIAHALGNICRFTGHCKEFFSVAQHSILASHYAETLVEKQQALLHDASEAYLSDVSRPLKRCIEFTEYKKFEKTLQDMIFTKFGLPTIILPSIKIIDNRLLYTEGRDLMNGTNDWHDEYNTIPYDVQIIPVSNTESKEWFLKTFNELFQESNVKQ